MEITIPDWQGTPPACFKKASIVQPNLCRYWIPQRRQFPAYCSFEPGEFDSCPINGEKNENGKL